MSIVSFLLKRKILFRTVSSKCAPLKARRFAFEQLEDRTLLTASPTVAFSSILSAHSDAALVANENPTTVSAALAESVEAQEGFDIDYELLESGSVRVLGQTGLQQVSTMSYCAITDSVYVELWEKAISRWEEVISVGVEDTTYPYAVNGYADLEIDDVYLFLGFSDSFTSTSSLGSALNAGYYRDGGLGLAATGSLVFNANYFVSNPSESVQTVFYNTALHEIAHALGYNVSHFQKLGLVELTTDTPYDLDDLFNEGSSYYYYVGSNGVEQYLRAFPDDFIVEANAADRYLMETYTASGSFGAHLSSALGTYYLYLNERDGMTYSISPNFEATITPMTLGVLEDLGYSVNYDYADELGTPTPENLSSVAIGKTVLLKWENAAGDLSNSTSGDALYQIERLDVRAQYESEASEGWVVVATGIEGNTYYDATVEEGREYSYRVRSCFMRSNEEVGIFRAKSGDVISWESDASKFTIYALVNNGSNMLGWTRVVASTSNKTWTASTLTQLPEDGTTLYRVVAVGAILTETDPSRISNVAVATNASSYVPDGYFATDWNAIKRFLESEDSEGVKNGYKINGVQYTPDLLQNMSGLQWEEVDGVFRLAAIDWDGYGLVGFLDLSECSQLKTISVENNSISQISIGSCRIESVNVASNELSSFDASNLVSLESLVCSGNGLTTLDISNNLNLVYLDCSDNKITELDTDANWNLATLKCSNNPVSSLSLKKNKSLQVFIPWNSSLVSVTLPSGFASTIDLSNSDANSYAWIKANETVESLSAYSFDGTDVTVSASLETNGVRQVIVFYVGVSGEKPNAPTQFVFGKLNDGFLETSWTDDAVDEIGYKVYYSINDGEWRFADSVVSSPEVSSSVGSTVNRTAKGVNADSSYAFKVVAYKVDSNGNEIVSDPLTAIYSPVETSLDSPANFTAFNYDPESLTLQLSWEETSGAASYEVQYRRSDDGGESWLNSWTRSEILASTSRTATFVHEDSFYGFRVRAISAEGSVSAWTSLTFSYTPTLSSVANLAASDFNPDAQTLLLTWDPVASAAYYEVQYRYSYDNGSTWQVWTLADNTTTASRLAHSVYAPCAYEFRVRVRDSNGERSEWTVVDFSYVDGDNSHSEALIDLAFGDFYRAEGENELFY